MKRKEKEFLGSLNFRNIVIIKLLFDKVPF